VAGYRAIFISCLLLAVAFAYPSTNRAIAATVPVSPGADSLAKAIASAAPGDVLELSTGVYRGPITIDKQLHLIGQQGATIKGSGFGSTITVGAPDVTIKNLTITDSGRELETMDSGIFVNKSGDRAIIENNIIKDNLFGVYFWGPKNAVMRGNTVMGMRISHINQRGNGVSLWNSPGSIVENNEFRYGRDGIFTTTSRNNIFRNNRFRDLRIAVHYMYTNNSEISDNLSIGNKVGYALMFSNKLVVKGNRSVKDRNHGIMFNFANSSIIENNSVEFGKTKCVFIYNSNKNKFSGNRFKGCGIGIHFTAGSEQNTVTNNAFIANRIQVKYVGSRDLDWSSGGRGNYWSDNPAFDLDGNGLADTAYRPNDMIDRVVWAHPLAKLLLSSPAIQILRWAQSRFPALLPGGVVDSAPLMVPPEMKMTDSGKVNP